MVAQHFTPKKVRDQHVTKHREFSRVGRNKTMKPRVEKSHEVLQYIDPTKRVRVYRNLNNKCVSVKQGSKVECHATNVVLKDCDFIVSEAGQRRVRNSNRKNVHAFIEGYVVSELAYKGTVEVGRSIERGDFGWNTVYYNPYETDHWQLSSVPCEQYVDEAQWVDVWCDDVCGDVLAFNLSYKKMEQ